MRKEDSAGRRDLYCARAPVRGPGYHNSEAVERGFIGCALRNCKVVALYRDDVTRGESNGLLVFWHFIGNMDDKRLPLVDSTGNPNAATAVTRAALTLWYYKTLFF